MEGAEATLTQTSLNLTLDDGTLFGNDAGEDEPVDILNSYFVDQAAFQPFLSTKNRYAVARSKKGMGKSALLSKMAFDLAQVGDKDDIVVRVIGSQVVSEGVPDFKNFLDAQAFWIRNICSRINSALGEKIGFAFSDTQMSLVEAAEMSGLRGRSLVGALLSRIKSQHIPIEILVPSKGDAAALLDRALAAYADKHVWFLVDDIDASFANTPEQQLLVGSFFSACRHVATNFQGVSIRTTVRTDVWSNLRSIEDLDKSEQYIIDIEWTKTELRSILSKKILAWIQRERQESPLSGLDYISDAEVLIELAFDRRLRWGDHRVPPFQAINILSAGRPRWVSQLCRLAGVRAARAQKRRISSVEVNASMHDFTRYRINDLYKEHGHQFSKIERLVSTFIGPTARFSTDELCSKINREFVGPVGVNNVPEVDGEVYSNPLQLASLLYRVGFLVARFGDRDSSVGVDFLTYSDRPELLRYGAPNDKDLTWEIYPSYRQRLKQGRSRVVA
jgi:hypothetical protein